LDVHAETIAVAVAEAGSGEVRSEGTIPNRPESVRKLMKKLAEGRKLKCCYEAGPTGYVLYWQLTQLGVACEVIAPSLIPTKAGDRVKTDRRDAERLARCYRAGELTAVWVPDKRTKLCGIWCGHAKRPSRISFGIAVSWGSFCCATAGGPLTCSRKTLPIITRDF
jgi:transposase